jgi:hypothetical protein
MIGNTVDVLNRLVADGSLSAETAEFLTGWFRSWCETQRVVRLLQEYSKL